MTGDEEIVKRIRAAIEAEPRVNVQSLKVNLEDGRIVLGGDVHGLAEKRLAVRLAQGVDGTGGIVDRLCVLSVEPRGDGEILDSFTRLLLGQPEFKNCALRRRDNAGRVETLHETNEDDRSGDITFSVAEGAVVLEGFVISLSHRRMVEVLAWWVPGCRNVANQLAIIPAEGDSDDEVSDAVRLAFEMDPLLAHADQINLSTREGVVTLQGTIPSEEERQMAEFDVWCVAGVGGVENRLEVRR